MSRLYEAFQFEPQHRPGEFSVPLDGVPQIPERVAVKLMGGYEEWLTADDIEQCDAAIKAAKAEIRRRHEAHKLGVEVGALYAPGPLQTSFRAPRWLRQRQQLPDLAEAS